MASKAETKRRNREAAQRCREKKKIYFAELKDRNTQLEAANHLQEMEIRKLTEENLHARTLLTIYGNRQSPEVAGFLQRSANAAMEALSISNWWARSSTTDTPAITATATTPATATSTTIATATSQGHVARPRATAAASASVYASASALTVSEPFVPATSAQFGMACAVPFQAQQAMGYGFDGPSQGRFSSGFAGLQQVASEEQANPEELEMGFSGPSGVNNVSYPDDPWMGSVNDFE